jgi:5-methylcytosine-specific restriction endonuclease McrA
VIATPRRGPLHVGEPKAPDSPLGVCRWCGERIVILDPDDYRRARRRYHYGDEHEEGDIDCLSRWKESTTWDARHAVKLRDLEANGRLFCAACGLVVFEPGKPWPEPLHRLPRAERPDLNPEIAEQYRPKESPWECDHRIPLEDGGPHHIDNLQVLCTPCHRHKTAHEAAARAERRRLSRLLALPPDRQLALAEAA